MSPVVEFKNVSKQFRLRRNRPRSLQELFLSILHGKTRTRSENIWSLRDVTFEVCRGEMVGLIGANGAGKSTALKLISRIIAPTSGEVRIEGQVTGLLELGAGFHPDLSGRENVYLNGAIMGMSRKEVDQRLDAIIDFAELEEFIDAPVRHYSSGMYMRLGFSTAVHSNADILLVDEVLAVGDQAFQSKCLQKITELRHDGMTILLVSHDAATVRRMCDRAVWLDRGRMRSVGPVDEIIADYMEQVWHEREEELAETEQEQAGPADQEREAVEQRWGSGEAVVKDVVFLGAEGREQHVFCTDETLVARIYYEASQRVERPTFGVAIYRDDDMHVNGPNSVSDGYDIPFIEGSGYVDYSVGRLPLLPGRYEFTAAIYDHTSTHPYDHRHRAFIFEVQAGSAGEREGLVHIPSTWEHTT